MLDAKGQGTWCLESRESGTRPKTNMCYMILEPAARLHPVAWRGLAAL